jgi:hypothetical protein
MAKKQMTPRQILRQLIVEFRPFLYGNREPTSVGQGTNATIEKGEDRKLSTKAEQEIILLATRFRGLLERAFRDARLDIGDAFHWKVLLIWYAMAFYLRRRVGAPKRWTKRRLQQLLKDVNDMRARKPGLSEEKYCKLLSEGKSGITRYKGKDAGTLRRSLQRAKAMENREGRQAAPKRA